MDPIQSGQLTREEIEKAEADPTHKLKLADPKVRLPEATGHRQGRTLYAGVAPSGSAQRDPVAGAQSCRTQGRADHAAGRHHQVDHHVDPRPHPLEFRRPAADGPGDARPVQPDPARLRSRARGQGKAGAGRTGRDAAAGRSHHRESAGARRNRPRSRPANSTFRPCSPSSSSLAARRKTRARKASTRVTPARRDNDPNSIVPFQFCDRANRARRRAARLRNIPGPTAARIRSRGSSSRSRCSSRRGRSRPSRSPPPPRRSA